MTVPALVPDDEIQHAEARHHELRRRFDALPSGDPQRRGVLQELLDAADDVDELLGTGGVTSLGDCRRAFSEGVERMRAQEQLLTTAVNEHVGELPPGHPVLAGLMDAARNVREWWEAWERLDPDGANQQHPEGSPEHDARLHLDREFLKQAPTTPALTAERKKQEARDATAGLRVDVQRVLQRGGGEKAQYDLELKDGTLIPIGKFSKLLSRAAVRDAIARERHVLIRGKRDEWNDVVEALLTLIEQVDGESDESETRAWLTSPVSDARGEPVDLDNAEDRKRVLTGIAEHGFVDTAGRVYLYLPRLKGHIVGHHNTQVTPQGLGARLGQLGWEKHKIQQRGELARVYWRSPAGWRGEVDDDDEEGDA